MAKRSLIIAVYLNAALLSAIIVLLLTRSNVPTILPAAFAQSTPTVTNPSSVYVMPAQFAERTWGCYLVDPDAQTLCAYQYYPGEKQLRLIAARNFKYDRKLNDFNTDHPKPQEVKDLLEKQNSAGTNP